MRAPQPVYRPIFQKALKTAWFHRELWPLAAVAGLLGTGTILNDLLNQVRTVFVTKQSLGDTDSAIRFLNAFFSNLVRATPANAIASFLIFFGLSILFVSLLLAAQHAILRTVHRAAAKKAPVSGKILLKEVRHPRFRRLLIINAFFKVLLINLLLVSGLLVSGMHVNTVPADAFFGLIFVLTVTTLALSLNALNIFSLIAVTRDEASTTDALTEAWESFKAHPGVSLEMSVLLFGANFVFTCLYIAMLFLGGVPFTLLFITAFQSGSIVALSFVSLLGALLLVTFTIAFGGFVTTFTYSAWTELAYKILRVKKLAPRLHVHGKNLLAAFAKSH